MIWKRFKDCFCINIWFKVEDLTFFRNYNETQTAKVEGKSWSTSSKETTDSFEK